MNPINFLTAFLMALVAAVVILWDTFLAAQHYKTVSEIMLAAAREFMVLPVAWGVLAGHFFFWFWPGQHEPFGTSIRYWVLAGTGVAILLWDLWIQHHPFPPGSWLWYARYPFVWLLLGIGIGRLFFPQSSNFDFDYLRRG